MTTMQQFTVFLNVTKGRSTFYVQEHTHSTQTASDRALPTIVKTNRITIKTLFWKKRALKLAKLSSFV